ncbi:phage major capsid protein [Bradyrhizobium sp. USDA 10063]
MSDGLADLVREVQQTRAHLNETFVTKDEVDAFRARLDGLEGAINGELLRLKRPGFDGGDDVALERKHAHDYLTTRLVCKNGATAIAPVSFGSQDIDTAMTAARSFTSYLRAGDFARMPDLERKALSEFSLGGIGVLVPPEISNRILSCLTDPGDLTGVVDSMTIAGASVQFLVDNVDGEELFGWACETDCAVNASGADVARGLGQLELKPEELRGLICATRSFLDDAGINIENWITQKGQQGVRRIASRAIATGSGIGMPVGILNPAAGIPVCETSDNSPAGQFTWQDLLLLKWQVPVQYHGAGGAYLMNQNTFALTLTMSDANGRPIMMADPTQPERYLLNGSPVIISEHMPDVAPGNVAVAFGGWKAAYMLVNRRALTILPDPYSSGACVLFKLFARLGGGVICTNAARLLRIN